MGDARTRKLFEGKVAELISRWKEVNPKMDLKIVFVGNTTLIGEIEEMHGHLFLRKPRAIGLGQDPQGRQVLALQVLVGEPDEVELVNISAMFDVKQEALINLYIQATTGIIPVKDLSNVIPIKGGDGGGKGGKLPPFPQMVG